MSNTVMSACPQTNLQVFNFNDFEIRVVVDDTGQPLWVAADVARALGYNSAKDMTRRLEEDEKGGRIVPTPGGNQSMSVINEPGLYASILRSRRPEAKGFKRWVTHDVLPAIRRTGSYNFPRYDLPDSYPDALRKLANCHEKIIALLDVAEMYKNKADYVEQFVSADDLISIRTLASQLHIAETRLRSALMNHKWIYRVRRTSWASDRDGVRNVYDYRPYSPYRDYFQLRPCHTKPRYTNDEVRQTLWVTAVGAVSIRRALSNWGYIP